MKPTCACLGNKIKFNWWWKWNNNCWIFSPHLLARFRFQKQRIAIFDATEHHRLGHSISPINGKMATTDFVCFGRLCAHIRWNKTRTGPGAGWKTIYNCKLAMEWMGIWKWMREGGRNNNVPKWEGINKWEWEWGWMNWPTHCQLSPPTQWPRGSRIF